MTLNFNQIVIMLVFMILYMLIIYILIFRKFKRFLLEQQYIHEQAMSLSNVHLDESSLTNKDTLKD